MNRALPDEQNQSGQLVLMSTGLQDLIDECSIRRGRRSVEGGQTFKQSGSFISETGKLEGLELFQRSARCS